MSERTYENNPITAVQDAVSARTVQLMVSARAFHDHTDLQHALTTLFIDFDQLRDHITAQLLDAGICDVELELRY